MLTRFIVLSFFQGGSGPIARSIIRNPGFLPAYLGLWAWLQLSSMRPFWSLGFERHDALPHVLRGAFVAGLMMAVIAGLAIVRGADLPPGSQTSGLGALGIGFLSLLSYGGQGPAEDALFRRR